jgi:CheY-like chemotaxis protein
MRRMDSDGTMHPMERTVVIVDDNAGFRTQAHSLLASVGFDVIGEAADGASAVEIIRALCPELVLLDVQLPDRSGLEVARLLRGQPDPPTIILISSREATDYGAGIDRSGADAFISKAELSARALRVVLGETDR